jgi:hypothetical protein
VCGEQVSCFCLQIECGRGDADSACKHWTFSPLLDVGSAMCSNDRWMSSRRRNCDNVVRGTLEHRQNNEVLVVSLAVAALG